MSLLLFLFVCIIYLNKFMENFMEKLNLKKVFLVLYCLIFFIFIIYYLINFIGLNNLKNDSYSINSSYLNLNSKTLKSFAIKTTRVSSFSLVRTKKLQSYFEIGGLELPVQGATGYASIKMNLMLEPSSTSRVVSTLSPRNRL